MHSSNDDKKTEQELSETWQALLGKQGAGEVRTPRVDPTFQVQPLASDPWNELLKTGGMQPVDLQQVRLHDLRALSGNDQDVEQALNIIREATGQLPKLDEKK